MARTMTTKVNPQTQPQIRGLTPEEIDHLERMKRQMDGLRGSTFLSFEIGKKQRIEFNPLLTKIDPHHVFGKGQRI
jgi:hypothetical protein